MSHPFLSIIMPVYNNAQYVSDAIESILNQTYQNYEFIIIDDASVDDSSSIVENIVTTNKLFF